MPPGGQGLNKKDPTVKNLLGQQEMMIKSRCCILHPYDWRCS